MRRYRNWLARTIDITQKQLDALLPIEKDGKK
jgi:hypothetical protein